VLVTGMVLSFFNLGAWGALYAVTPEVYPTALRATGAGAAAGFGRIASIAAPLCVPPLLELGGSALVFGTFAAFFVVAAAAALRLPERRGQSLDDPASTPIAAGRWRTSRRCDPRRPGAGTLNRCPAAAPRVAAPHG